MTAMELLLLITKKFQYIYYDPIDLCFTPEALNKKELNKLLAVVDLDLEEQEKLDVVYNIRIPTYEEIDHKEIMQFFIKEYIEDKEIRKTLFNILRRHDYVTSFIDKLKELDLYEYFDDCCGTVYDQIMDEWLEKNGIDLSKKK